MINSGTFRPGIHLRRRGLHRRFHIIPQHGFATRYLPIDRKVFHSLHRILWKSKEHPHPQAEEFKSNKDRDADFFARKAYWWTELFDFKGVIVPGVNIRGREKQQKEFSFFMATDGFGCSFVCWKPKSEADKEKITPMNVRISEKTVLGAVDPGRTNIVTGIILKLFGNAGGQGGTSWPAYLVSKFKVSAASWHDKAYHNGAQKRRAKLRKAWAKNGTDISGLEREIPSGKTMRADVFLKHAIETVKAYPILYEHYKHYKQHRAIRWKVYWKEQKALHELCSRVKGDPSLKKEDVVIAYGAAQFPSTTIGKRAVPVKRFRRMLEEYVTVVPTPEYRTSQVCSNGCHDQAGSAAQMKKDKLIPVYGKRTKPEKRGRPIHAVRRCLICRTIWDRDVNAAWNILRMFWYLREHDGQKPPWARPPPPPSP